MKRGWLWVAAFAVMFLLGIVIAYATSGFVAAILNPAQFSYKGNTYRENQFELSTDMEHKTNGVFLYDFSGHSPGHDLRLPDSLTSTSGKYGLAYRWSYPRNLPINGSDIGIMSESYTIEAWLNPQNPESTEQIMSWAGISDKATRRLLVAANGSAWAQMTEPGLNFFSSVALPRDSWTHVAFVYDSDAGRISWIINGAQDRTSEAGYASDWNGGFKIGGWTDSGSYSWSGKIDEFRISHAALSVSQVVADMNRPIRKAVSLTNLTPGIDKAILTLEIQIPQEVTADVNGNAEFDTFIYGDLFVGSFTILHGAQTSQSALLDLHTGDEYSFSLTSSYLSPNIVSWIIVVAFPLSIVAAYVVKRITSRKAHQSTA
jgi:hypothetical protein